MGADGALVSHRGAIYRHEGIKVDVVDTIGSGDAFLAGFLQQLLSEKTVKEALILLRPLVLLWLQDPAHARSTGAKR